MKYFLTLLPMLMVSTSLQAEQLVRAVSLSEEPLTVTAAQDSQLQPLVDIRDPGISSPLYALKGMVRYETVEGDGYLQLDNDFGERGTFFTKSLAASGSLGKISGSSDWRPFTLPFQVSNGDQGSGAAKSPEKLTLSVYLPSTGTVSISNVALYQYARGENPLESVNSWFSSRSSGLIGGFCGAFLGLWGALIGTLAGRGKARRFVTRSADVLLFLGILSVIAGLYGLASAQPYTVYFPFLLIGVIVLVVTGSLRGRLNAQYEHLELKKMQSMDA